MPRTCLFSGEKGAGVQRVMCRPLGKDAAYPHAGGIDLRDKLTGRVQDNEDGVNMDCFSSLLKALLEISKNRSWER